MDIIFEADASEIWQDTLDIIQQTHPDQAFLAMLQQCVPVELDENELKLETSMRMVMKNITLNQELIENCLSQAAFKPLKLSMSFVPAHAPKPVMNTFVSPEEYQSIQARQAQGRLGTVMMPAGAGAPAAPVTPAASVAAANPSTAGREITAAAASSFAGISTEQAPVVPKRRTNPLAEEVMEDDSRLTFERFLVSEENEMAYNAAVQVANGTNRNYNPLFIYGKSGLGKTHLLRAIQNYVVQNDPSRLCVYKDATSFIEDYTQSMKDKEKGAVQVLAGHYIEIDILIIDDIQKMAGKEGTIGFFFDIFNALKSHGKQIVLAADRSPAQLGMGAKSFDERVTSRLSQGFSINIEVPRYELKYRLIETFCENIQKDFMKLGSEPLSISEDMMKLMADRSGANIRTIEGFCQKVVIMSADCREKGLTLTSEMIELISKEMWPGSKKVYTAKEIQQAVERHYDISHEDLIGNKRNKNLMMPRHVAVWLMRELCDKTLVDIGRYFGGRSHATIMHSIGKIDEMIAHDKLFYDELLQLKDSIKHNV